MEQVHRARAKEREKAAAETKKQLAEQKARADTAEENLAAEKKARADAGAPEKLREAINARLALERAAAEMLDWHGTGMSFMEMSHRSSEVVETLAAAEERLRRLLAIDDDYAVLFLQGGATGQFMPRGRRRHGDGDQGQEQAPEPAGEQHGRSDPDAEHQAHQRRQHSV